MIQVCTSFELKTLALTPKRTLFELLCESRMNISELEVPPPQQVQRVSTEASDKDAEVRTLQIVCVFFCAHSPIVSIPTTFKQANSRKTFSRTARSGIFAR